MSKAAYDEDRIATTPGCWWWQTSTIREVIGTGRLLIQLNRREISGRRGLIVSGPWAAPARPPRSTSWPRPSS